MLEGVSAAWALLTARQTGAIAAREGRSPPDDGPGNRTKGRGRGGLFAAAVALVASSSLFSAPALAQSQGAAQDRTNCSNFAINTSYNRSMTVTAGQTGTLSVFTGNATGTTGGGTSHAICNWSLTITRQAAQGTGGGAAGSGGGSVSYQANSNANGADSFDVQLRSNYSGQSGFFTVNVNVQGNPAPTVNDVSASTGYNQAVSIPSSVNGSTSSLNIGEASNGSVSVSGFNMIYTPRAGFYGQDQFAYSANGPGGRSADATVRVTVAPPPAPTAGNMTEAFAYQTGRQFSVPASGVADTISVTSQPANGRADWFYPTITYTPNNGFYGTDTLRYRVNGPGGSSPEYTVTLNVAPPPAPTAGNTTMTASYNGGEVSRAMPISGVATEARGVTPPSNGTYGFFGTTAYYTPRAGFYGSDSFTYRAVGPGGNSAPATVSVTVTPPAAPSVASRSVSTAYNTSVSVPTGVSGVYSSLGITAFPANGNASIVGTDIVYAPSAGFIGTNTIQFRAEGPGGFSNTGTITVTVNPPPAPTSSNIAASTGYNTAVEVQPTLNGVVGGTNTIASPSSGGLAKVGNGWRYTPNAGFYGSDSWTFSVSGPGGTSPTYTVTMTVAPPPAPGAGDVSATTAYQTAASIALTPSGVYSSVVMGSAPANGSASITGTTATYTPNAGFYGVDSFVYRAIGPGGNSPTRTVTITVGNPPAPNAGDVSATTAYETAASIALTPSGVYSTVTKVANPSNGSVTISGTTATYTPAAGFLGTDTFTYRATGPGGNSPTRTVTVTVAAPAAPGAGDVSATTAYETAASIALTPSGVFSSVSKMSDPAHGTVTISGTTATYTPAAGYYGADAFTYRATGPGGNSATRTVSITVGNPPAPDAGDVSATTAYQTAASITLTPSGVFSSVSKMTDPAHGTVTITGTTATYNPAAGYYGADAFTYRATGPGGNSATRTVSITVGLPTAPSAAAVSATTAYETAKAIALAPSGVTTDAEIVSQPAYGSVSVSGMTATYTPNVGYYGQDTFDYRVTGPGGASAPAKVTVTVGLPPAPTVSDTTLSTAFQTAKAVILPAQGVLTTVNVVDAPAHGGTSISGTTLTYTPAAGYHGADVLTFSATGPGGVSNIGTLAITVGTPAAPTVGNLTLSTPYERAVSGTFALTGYQPQIAKASEPQHGSADVAGSSVTYTPAPGFYGQDTFTVIASNAGGNSAPATVTVTVGLPAAPSLANGSLTTAYERAGSAELTPSGVFSTLEIVSAPSHGQAAIVGRTLTFTPDALFYGADTMRVRAVGPGGNSAPATIAISVGLPGAPSVQSATLNTGFEAAGTVDLTVSGVSDRIELVTQPSHGSAVIVGEQVRYTPAAGYYGADELTVRAVGPGGNSAPATVTVSVGLPAAPSASAVTLSTAYETAGEAELRATGVYDGFALVAPPAHGRATVNGGRVSYIPDAGYFGPDSFTYRATGPGGNSAPAAVAVTVGLPAAPVAQAGALETPFETVGTVILTASGVHDGFAIAATPAHGVASLVGDEVRYTPNAGYYGDDQLTFTARGPGGTSAPAVVAIKVGLPGKPVASPGSIQVPYETVGSATLRATGVFDGFTITTQPQHGRVDVSGAQATYTPNPSFYGADAFAYIASGPGGNSNPAVIAVNVGLPAAPVVSGANLTTAYETAGSVRLVVSGVFTRVELAGDPAKGRAVLQGQELTYTPNAAFYGADELQVRAIGPGGTSALATVAISVVRPNAPAVADATLTTAYETAGQVELTATGIYSAVEIVSNAGHGAATLSGSTLRYVPAAGFFGDDVVTVRATGPGGASALASVAIKVGLPAVPKIADAEIVTAYETAGSVELIASGVYSSVEIVSNAGNGAATLSGSTLSYTPAAGFFGDDVVTVRAVGPGGVSSLGRVSIKVGLPAAPKIADAEIVTAYETAGSVELIASGVYSSVEIVSNAGNGVATLTGSTLSYVPAAEYYGEDRVLVRAVGPGGASADATVSIKVGLPAAPAVSADDLTLTTPFETPVSSKLEATGVMERFETVEASTNGAVAIDGDTLTYTPAPGFFGVDRTTYVAVGPGGRSQPRNVVITVGVPAPSAEDVAAITEMDVPVKFDLAEKVEHVASAAIVEAPKSGAVSLDGTQATYTPNAAFFGTDAFTFTLEGPGGVSKVVTATVTVEGGPPPEANPLEKTGLMGEPITFDVTADLEGGPFTAVRLTEGGMAGTTPAADHGGKLTVQGLKIIFTPAADWIGRASFGFSVENRYGWSEPARATAIINPRPETGDVIDAETWAGRPVDIPLTDNARGGPFTSADIVAVSLTDAVTLDVTKVGERYVLKATPIGQFVGLVQIRYTLRNAFAVSEPGLVRLTVKERPDPSRDPEVTGLINAQTQAAYRFGSAQTTNVLRRLEQLHDGGPTRNSINLSLVPMNEDARPWENDAQRERRTYMEQAGMLVPAPAGTPATSRKKCVAVTGQEQGEGPRVGLWAEGVLDLGFNRKSENRAGIDFSTDGITVGVDTRVNEKLAIGAGVGYGRDESDIGVKGTASSADAYSAFAYASWLPRKNLFVDGVLGFSSMDFDAVRFVTQTGGFLSSNRHGHQWFGSIAAGYESRGRLHWSPYGRVEFSDVTLRSFREYGDDIWALDFKQQNSSQVRAALGVHGDYPIQYRSGVLKPRFRVEYLHDLKNGGAAGVTYADWAASPLYQIELARYDDRNLRLGLGLLWEGVDGVAVGFEYDGTVLNDTAQQGRLRLDFSIKY